MNNDYDKNATLQEAHFIQENEQLQWEVAILKERNERLKTALRDTAEILAGWSTKKHGDEAYIQYGKYSSDSDGGSENDREYDRLFLMFDELVPEEPA